MKKALLPVLASVLVLSSCKKDKDAKFMYQLTRAEIETQAFDFTYNDQNLLDRIDITDTRTEDPSQPYYVLVNYSDGVPSSLDLYVKPPTGAGVPVRNFRFGRDSRNNIAYTAAISYQENGQLPPAQEPRDTTRFQYNADGKITGVKNYWDGEFRTWTYDAQGNYFIQDESNMEGGIGWTLKMLEQRYDNAINPFSNMGLGQFIYAFAGEEFELKDQLLSANNPVSFKEDFTEFNHEGEGIVSNKILYYMTRTNTLDENGVLKTSELNTKEERVKNGQIESTDNDGPYTRKFTVVKKQL
jgi:YD repeat-containing protein